MSPPSSSSAHLEVLQGPLQGQTLILSAPETTIGRDAGQGISLSNYNEVSRRHARFYVRQGTWCLEDLGATNGTFVNSARATPSFSLVDGVVIKMGDFQARFRLTTSSPHVTTPGATQLSPLPPAPLPSPFAPVPVAPYPVVPYPVPVGYPVEPPKSVALALLFSLLLIGGGQFYNGDVNKGVTLLCSSLLCGVASLFTCGLTLIGCTVIWIFGIIDAVQSAERINRDAGWPRRY